jgi:alpha-2-macroglobulin
MVLAGLAGLGDDVLVELRALIGQPGSLRASLWIAIGLAAVGDENGARALERELLTTHGQQFGPWVRLQVGASIDETDDAARLLLMLSSRLGEPFARDIARYLADHPTKEHSLALERLAYLRASLDRLPHGAGRFAWSIDGERHEVELEPGGAFTLVLTAPQRRTFALEPVAGKLSVVTAWTGLGADLPSGGPVTITRTITPGTNAPDDRLVRVHIRITFGALATAGCWQITDLAPSGLVPIERRSDWPEADIASGISAPYSIDAQRVSWCASPKWQERGFGYVARVVSPGTYRWEPAIIQSVDAPEVGAATDGFTFTIR